MQESRETRTRLLGEVEALRSELTLHMGKSEQNEHEHQQHFDSNSTSANIRGDSRERQREDDMSVKLGSSKRIQDIIKKLNMKINNLYSWHLVELDLVSRQQLQLNEMKSELDTTKDSISSFLSRRKTGNSEISSVSEQNKQSEFLPKRAPEDHHETPTNPSKTAQNIESKLSEWFSELDKDISAVQLALQHVLDVCESPSASLRFVLLSTSDDYLDC